MFIYKNERHFHEKLYKIYPISTCTTLNLLFTSFIFQLKACIEKYLIGVYIVPIIYPLNACQLHKLV